MRQVFVFGRNDYRLIEAEKPTIESPTDAIVRVTATTVCASDLHIMNASIAPGEGFALGHEFVGVVEEVGAAVETLAPGDRVSGPAMSYSGFGENFRNGQPQADGNGAIFGTGVGIGGAMSEYIKVAYADMGLAQIPATVSDRQALAIGDILSTGWTAVKKAVDGPGRSLVVFGAGPVGLSAIHTARLFGAVQVIAVDPVEERLQIAKQLGATATVNPDDTSVADAIDAITRGRGADAIVDCAGVQATIDLWPVIARPGAKVGMVALPGGSAHIPLTGVFEKNMTIWAGLGDVTHMSALLACIEDGILDPSPIFNLDYDFGDIEHAIRDVEQRKPGLIKPFISLGP